MNKHYELKPISDPPKEDNVYIILNKSGSAGQIEFKNGEWRVMADSVSHYLSPVPAIGARWRKTDYPPEVGEYVLVCVGEETILKGRLMYNGWVAFFADGEKLVGPAREVTKWMPLPALEQNESSDRIAELEKGVDGLRMKVNQVRAFIMNQTTKDVNANKILSIIGFNE